MNTKEIHIIKCQYRFQLTYHTVKELATIYFVISWERAALWLISNFPFLPALYGNNSGKQVAFSKILGAGISFTSLINSQIQTTTLSPKINTKQPWGIFMEHYIFIIFLVLWKSFSFTFSFLFSTENQNICFCTIITSTVSKYFRKILCKFNNSYWLISVTTLKKKKSPYI